uniref:RYYR-CCHC domain-containing protein n=1 Tax=Wuchereria bancrofti TaxID=6293 RepID=A0A1I8ECJ8_WUCBA
MTERNWLSSGKDVALDGGNDIDISVVGQERLPIEISEDRSLESLPNSSEPSDFPIHPTKLNVLSIAIAEKDDPRKFRIYRSLNCEPQESTIYYRCAKCESLEKKAFGSGVRSRRYKPYVKTLRGKLVGNAHPEHHPGCHAVTKEIQELQEMDRACRAKIRASYLSHRSPQKIMEHALEDSSNIDIQSNYNLRRRPKRLSLKFDPLSRDINESELSEIDCLLRFISEASVNNIAEATDHRSIYSLGTSSSKSTGYSSLIVPEPDGISVRIYDANGKLADQGVTHYYCSRCDDLYQKENNESIRTVLKAESDLVVEYPTHHAECSPSTLESLRELGDGLKDFCVVASRRIIPLKAESEYNIFHEQDESFLTGGSNEQNWDTTAMDEEILINPTSVPKLREQRCFCRRLYEENMELYQEMLRSVHQMRALINEMKRISGANAEYYIEDGQVLEESDSSTLYREKVE